MHDRVLSARPRLTSTSSAPVLGPLHSSSRSNDHSHDPPASARPMLKAESSEALKPRVPQARESSSGNVASRRDTVVQQSILRRVTIDDSSDLAQMINPSQLSRRVNLAGGLKRKVFYPASTLPETIQQEETEGGETMATLHAKLDMLCAIDEIRDEFGDDPTKMLQAIVKHLEVALTSPIVLLYVNDRVDNCVKLAASNVNLPTPPTAEEVISVFPPLASKEHPCILDSALLSSLVQHGETERRMIISFIHMDEELLGRI